MSQITQQSLIKRVILLLLMDILAFTMILPLFPAVLHHYQQQADPDFLWFLAAIRRFRGWIRADQETTSLDYVLMGGALGSLFSLLQFLVSPWIGRLSDRLGRKPVLLLTLMGNIASAFLWMTSWKFSLFVWSRVISGLSEGNVQLSIAMISDVIPPAHRSSKMAWIGIAFAVGFTVGPPLGASFAHVDLPVEGILPFDYMGAKTVKGAALLCFLLLCLEFILTLFVLPETLGKKSFVDASGKQKADSDLVASSNQGASSAVSTGKNDNTAQLRQRKASASSNSGPAGQNSNSLSPAKSKQNLIWLGFATFTYLFLFSALEFTLPFLTHHILLYTPREQGLLFGTAGILSSLIQGGYVRRALKPKPNASEASLKKPGRKEKSIAKLGIVACILFAHGLGLLASQQSGRLSHHPFYQWFQQTFHLDQEQMKRLLIGWVVVSMAVASATVVNAFNALSTVLNPDQHAASMGERVGWFRAVGQLGRAVGPIVGCAVYWTMGPSVWFFSAAGGLLIPFLVVVARI